MRERVGSLLTLLIRQIEGERTGRWLELNLTMPQFKMLYLVHRLGPVPMSRLAVHLGITLPGATSLIHRLADLDLVNRERAPRDRRVVWVSTSASGRELMLSLLGADGDGFDSILGQLGIDDLHRCGIALETVNKAVELVLRGAPPNSVQTTSVGSVEVR